MFLNPADREQGLILLGTSNGRQRAQRQPNASSPWVGIRADGGVVGAGRWAFCVWNESGGNLRVGWSCAQASLKLGTDPWGFGYGGTATKSNANQFTKYGQTYGQGDAITCMVDLDRRAILFTKNGREIPGDAFRLEPGMAGWPLFPHVYTKEATFAVSFDGSGGAPPLQGGFQWIATARRPTLVPSPRAPPPGSQNVDESKAAGGSANEKKFVLTSYGWRTAQEAGVSETSQEWRGALDAYVKHFTALLELEYEAEREAVVERVQKRTPAQLQADGVGMAGLSAEFDRESGRITLWAADGGPIPYLAEISRGRTVLLSTLHLGVDVDDATKTISGEVESIRETLVLSTQYERLPGATAPGGCAGQVRYRVDLGPNIIAYKRIDRMLDELQRCLGVAQAKNARNAIEKLNTNKNLEGLLLPGAPLANALYADISESSAAASKWDPLQRPKPNPAADVSKAAREPDIGAPPYQPRSAVPSEGAGRALNASQRFAAGLVLDKRRRFSLIQGPPGTGKTTTAVAIICGWLRKGRGPILASSFSNRGTDNLAEGLHNLGVRVLRMGLCPADRPYSLETRLSECGAKRGDKGLQAVLQTIDVVAATCIGCGMGPLDKLKFPYIVVDEAAQVIEPAVILPLGKGAVQAVMVGDQCQLPATVLSQEAQKGGLDISMFDRLLSMGMEVQMLTEQYRMHPQIAAFCSWRFYRGFLRSAVKESDRQRPPHLPINAPLGFLHVEAEERSKGASKVNPEEARCVAWLVERVLQTLPSRLTGDEVGIITPYAAQVAEIRRALPPVARGLVQISSVDAFQGLEKDVIIVSLVRANRRGDVGFVSDWRRLNVALTRARRLCVIVASMTTWLVSDSALIREWLSFHGPTEADVRMFRGGTLLPLPQEHLSRLLALRAEFAEKRPEAGALPRVSTAARDATGTGKAKHLALQVARALADAISKQDPEALQGAIAQAAEAGIENSTVEEAEALLQKLAAVQELADAVSRGDPEQIQAAIDAAKEVGVDGAKVREAEAALRRVAAEQELAAALQGAADEGGLRAALAKARQAGVQPAKLHDAELALKAMAATRALAEAIGAGEEAALQRALAQAKAAGVDAPQVEEARLMLRHLAATRELHSAISSLDEGALTSALARAKEVGLHPTVTDEADRTLRRWIAARELSEAAKAQGDGDELEAGLLIALASAREADVDAEAIRAAESRLDALRVVKLLAAAIAEGDAEALRSNLVAARSLGLADPIVQEAEAHLQVSVAAHALQCAAEGRDAMALEVALRVARDAGVEASLVSAGEAKLRGLRGSAAPPAAAAAAKQLAATHELVAALELAGSVAEEDKAALRAALAEAAAAGVAASALAEARATLDRLQGGSSASSRPEPAAKRRRTAPAADAGAADPLRCWALCELEVAVLRRRKREAVENEDFDLAHEVKQQEAAAAARLAAARRRCGEAGQGAGSRDPSAVAAAEKELELVRKQKLEAVENEDYAAAAALRDREKALELQVSGGDGVGGRGPVAQAADAVRAALQLLDGGPGAREALLGSLDPGVAACAAGAGEATWEAVLADLRAAASAAT